MLKKLLRYDFKAVLRYWWIAALTSFGLALLGSACIGLLNFEKDLPELVDVTASLGLFTVILGFSAFSILSIILIFIRFYRNLFTDEGYLTFTLPVKHSHILNSKLIMSCVMVILSSAVVIFDILTMICLPNMEDAIEFFKSFLRFLNDLKLDEAIYLNIYLVEWILIGVAATLFSVLLLFCCITFASVITKKAKVITAIGIYYGVSSVLSFAMQIFFIFGFDSLIEWMSAIPDEQAQFAAAQLFFGILVFILIFCMLLYTFEHWLIDRKLNLS